MDDALVESVKRAMAAYPRADADSRARAAINAVNSYKHPSPYGTTKTVHVIGDVTYKNGGSTQNMEAAGPIPLGSPVDKIMLAPGIPSRNLEEK